MPHHTFLIIGGGRTPDAPAEGIRQTDPNGPAPLSPRLRVEHEDNANTMGWLAGLAMAGQAVSYDHLPFFYSDLFELGYEAAGEVDSQLEVVADWKEPYREGAVAGLRHPRSGILDPGTTLKRCGAGHGDDSSEAGL